MRLAVGAVWHQTNSFSPVATTLDDFKAYRYAEADALLRTEGVAQSALTGAIEVAADLGHEIVPLLDARAPAGAPVDATVFQTLGQRLRAGLGAVRGPVDGVLLDLSGAMVTASDPDAEAALVDIVRDVAGRDLPVVVTVGPHANPSPRLIDSVDALVGASDAPEVDPAQRGARAMALLTRIAAGEVRPTTALRQVPLLVPLAAQATSTGAMAEIAALARQIRDQPRVLSVVVSGGFPYADVPHAGAAVVVSTDAAPGLAADLATTLADALWERRERLAIQTANIETAIHEAMASRDQPVVLADTGDDPGAGGPADGTGLLWGLIDLGAPGAAIGVLSDPAAVSEAIEAGPGAEVALTIGARRDRLHGYPIDVRGRVARIGPGRIVREGSIDHGQEVDLGRSVVIESEGRHGGDITVILADARVEVDDPAFFRAHGIDPETKRILAVKSSLRYRVGFGTIASHMTAVATPGVTVPDFAFFPFRHLRRPIVPLDEH